MKFKKDLTIVNGIKTFYWEKNTGQKKVIVLLHGFPGNHKGLIDFANGLKNYRLIIPDLPASGESESLKKKHSLKNYAKHLDGFLKNLKIKQAIIIGHSFGSRVALVFSADYPKKVERLVLITPAVKIDGLVARIASLEYEIAGILPKHLKKTWLSNRFYQGAVHMVIFKSASRKRRKQIATRDAEEFRRLDPRASLELFNELRRLNLITLGEKVGAMSLIIASDKDEVATLKSVQKLASKFAKADFKIMENSGHLVVLERPLKTAKIVKCWLKQSFSLKQR